MQEVELLRPTKIIKSRRKSISLIIKNNGEFIIRAPLHTSLDEIFSFINQKQDWIINKRKESLNNQYNSLECKTGEVISLLGKQFIIETKAIKRISFNENILILPNENAKDILIKFLKKYAKNYISERTKTLATSLKLNYESISISSAKTNWGSCSSRNKLNFSYKLIMCPPEIVDYIIIHELCHTKIKNHSASYWQLVKTYLPNYKQYEKWLKSNRGIVNII